MYIIYIYISVHISIYIIKYVDDITLHFHLLRETKQTNTSQLHYITLHYIQTFIHIYPQVI